MLAFFQQHPDLERLEIKQEPILSLSGLELIINQRKVIINGQEVELTTKEYDILCLLAVNKGRVLTHSQIYNKVWGDTAFGNESKAVGYHIWNIRRKLCSTSKFAPVMIESVREVGYRLKVNN